MPSLIRRFEIPAADFERAIRFYQIVLGVTLRRQDTGATRLAIFPYEVNVDTGGAICHGASGQGPGPAGTLVYLVAGDDLSAALARVEPTGGKVLVAKTLIAPEIGYFALFQDCEGNHVGLYSPH